MWPDGRYRDLLGSRLPIIAAPMAGAGGVQLAAEAMAGGAVGSLPCALLAPDEILAQAAEVRARAEGPINLNFFCHSMPDDADDGAWLSLLRPFYDEFGVEPSQGAALRRPFDEGMCRVVEEARPELVSFHFGLPEDVLLDRVRASGARILGNATTVAEAKMLAGRGVDAVIAQGWEAGGHAGRFLDYPSDEALGLIALVPQAADVTGLPIIAAGGIGDGRGIAAALMLGATAVQIGTAYLHCPESLITTAHRAAMSGSAAQHTAFTNLFSGGLARGLPTRLTDELGRIRQEAPPFPLASVALAPLAKAADGFSPMWAGQSASLARPMPARELTELLGREALALIDRTS